MTSSSSSLDPKVPLDRRHKRLSSPSIHSQAVLNPDFYRLIGLLNGLQELCAVGTVEIIMPRRGMVGITAPDGWLWLETPSKQLKGQRVEVWLEALIDSGYIRATYFMTSGTAARIRVYVLPADIGKGLVPGMNQNHRTMLKRLLRSLDTSEQAWTGGNVQPEATQRIAMSSGVRKLRQPNNENYYYLDVRAVQLFRDLAYPEFERHSRYNLRQGVGHGVRNEPVY